MLIPLFLLIASLPQPSGGIAVPFRLTEDAMIVDASINGHPVSLLFDSGFGGTVVLDSKIEVGPESGTMKLRDFVGEMSVSTVALKSLKLGSVTLDPDEKSIVKQKANFSASYGTHVDGILGLSAIKDKVTEIDFQHHQFVFFPRTTDISKWVPDQKTTFLTKMLPIGGNAIELPVLAPSGQSMTMALDTGNAFYATSHKEVLERVGIWSDSQAPKYMRASGVASGAVDSWSKKMPNLTIFGVPVKQTVWDIIDLPSSDARGDGTVGFGFLSNFNITFDFDRRFVWFENWHQPIENAEPGDLGISAHYNPLDKAIEVVLVAPGSPAGLAGVKVGDALLSVAGVDLERQSARELRRLLEGPVGSSVQIATSRSGSLKRYTLTRQALTN